MTNRVIDITKLGPRIALTVVGIGLIVLTLWWVPRKQASLYRARFPDSETRKLDAKERLQLEKDIIAMEGTARLTLAQIMGGLGLLAGLFLTFLNVRVAQQNAKTARESVDLAATTAEANLRLAEAGKLTDRFSKAIELLGHDKLDVRLGGIYALERIAKDSKADHWTVMEVLTAFIREKTRGNVAAIEAYSREEDVRPDTDVQAALTVIARRTWRDNEPVSLDLSKSILIGANLIEAHLEEANLIEAHLERAYLIDARLEKANLYQAHLERAYLYQTHLEGADLAECTGLTWAKLEQAHLDGSTQLPPELATRRRAALQQTEAEASS